MARLKSISTINIALYVRSLRSSENVQTYKIIIFENIYIERFHNNGGTMSGSTAKGANSYFSYNK